jgi:alpha-ribazole phosphatase/probable phosphoglycerate mutase
MSELIFIRHAETDMAGRFCGHSDPELNERGYAQLPMLIDSLRAHKFDAVYTSDLRRAKDTATAIAKEFHLPYHPSPMWREINFGQWEGLTWEEIVHRDKIYADRWTTMFPDLPASKGEDFRDFEKRVLNAVDTLAGRPFRNDIAVVTHAGVLRMILRRLQECSEEEAWRRTSGYCCIVRHPIARPRARQTDEALL